MLPKLVCRAQLDIFAIVQSQRSDVGNTLKIRLTLISDHSLMSWNISHLITRSGLNNQHSVTLNINIFMIIYVHNVKAISTKFELDWLGTWPAKKA